jgi:DNA-binding Lrp family transcriptional regulator
VLTAAQYMSLRLALQQGLRICEQPYAALAAELGLDEEDLLSAIEQLRATGLIKRFGVVVRHRELGYTANAMVVWDVQDDEVDNFGEQLGRIADVSLSYRRPRRQPHWPFNLFCMIHGKGRRQVLATLKSIIDTQQAASYPHRVLFSTRRFKQQGADYVGTSQTVATACCAD